LALRGAIRGFGEALGPLQASATTTAYGLRLPEFEAEQEAVKLNYLRGLRDYEAWQRKSLQHPMGTLPPSPQAPPDITPYGAITAASLRPISSSGGADATYERNLSRHYPSSETQYGTSNNDVSTPIRWPDDWATREIGG